MSDEESFHRQRRMFAIIDGVVHIAPPNDPRSHQHWLVSEKLLDGYMDRKFEQIVRGFADKRGLFGYRGYDFSDSFVAGALDKYLPELIEKFDLKPEHEVWAGMKPGTVGDTWEGRFMLGTVAEFQEFAEIVRVQG